MAKRRELFGSNKIEIESCERHLVPVFGDVPEFAPDARIQSVYFAEGICNDDRFGAVVIAPDHLRPTVDMYGRVKFEFHEGNSVGLMLMVDRREAVTVEHPEIVTEEQAAAFVKGMREEGRLRFSGEKVHLRVPFADKDEAKSLGARWDAEEKKWYVMSRLADMDDFLRWLPEEAPATGPSMGA